MTNLVSFFAEILFHSRKGVYKGNKTKHHKTEEIKKKFLLFKNIWKVIDEFSFENEPFSHTENFKESVKSISNSLKYTTRKV